MLAVLTKTEAITNMNAETTSTTTQTLDDHQLQVSVILCTFIILYILHCITVVIIFTIKG